MVFRPTRGDAPPRIRPDAPHLPAVGGATVDVDVHRDPLPFELERDAVFRWRVTW